MLFRSEVTAIVILGAFAGDRAPPEGFERTDFPILRVKYLLPSGSEEGTQTWSEPQIVCYYNVRDRFPKELCTYFMSRTVIKSFDDIVRDHGRIIKTQEERDEFNKKYEKSNPLNFALRTVQKKKNPAP